MNRIIFSIGKKQKGQPLTLINVVLKNGTLEIREWRTNYYMEEKPGWDRISPSRIVPHFKGEITEESVYKIMSDSSFAPRFNAVKKDEIIAPQEKSAITSVADVKLEEFEKDFKAFENATKLEEFEKDFKAFENATKLEENNTDIDTSLENMNIENGEIDLNSIDLWD
jgi:hypothetical protein